MALKPGKLEGLSSSCLNPLGRPFLLTNRVWPIEKILQNSLDCRCSWTRTLDVLTISRVLYQLRSNKFYF
jgi:hypothetical protein